MQKNNNIKICLTFSFCYFILSSCVEDLTHFHGDPQAPGLSIFSDKANNLMTCYINGDTWETLGRTTGTFGSTIEITIQKYISQGIEDTLLINWQGNFKDTTRHNIEGISIVLPVAKGFGYKDFNNLQGKLLNLNTANGFITTYNSYHDFNYILHYSTQGTGNIYFHIAQIDSTSPGNYQGRMSGLFDANLGSIKITNGRFDHGLDAKELQFLP